MLGDGRSALPTLLEWYQVTEEITAKPWATKTQRDPLLARAVVLPRNRQKPHLDIVIALQRLLRESTGTPHAITGYLFRPVKSGRHAFKEEPLSGGSMSLRFKSLLQEMGMFTTGTTLYSLKRGKVRSARAPSRRSACGLDPPPTPPAPRPAAPQMQQLFHVEGKSLAEVAAAANVTPTIAARYVDKFRHLDWLKLQAEVKGLLAEHAVDEAAAAPLVADVKRLLRDGGQGAAPGAADRRGEADFELAGQSEFRAKLRSATASRVAAAAAESVAEGVEDVLARLVWDQRGEAVPDVDSEEQPVKQQPRRRS